MGATESKEVIVVNKNIINKTNNIGKIINKLKIIINNNIMFIILLI